MTAPLKGPIPAIPLTIITGFLGAGKTTLLNRLLKDPALSNTLVIINEFGDIGLDHLLLEKLDDDVVLMQSGCLCCTIRGDLLNTLEGLLRKRDNGRITPFQRILIETTGLADPAPIMQTVMSHPYLSLRYQLEGIVTIVDALNGLATIENHEESLRQIAVADRLLISKASLATNEQSLAKLRERLRQLNPSAPLQRTEDARVTSLLDCGLYDPTSKAADVNRWLRDEELLANLGQKSHRHADGSLHVINESAPSEIHDVNRHSSSIRAFTFSTDQAISAESFALFQEILRAAHGPKLLRLKAIVKVAENPEKPVIIHGVQHVFHKPLILEKWPDDNHQTRFVFITKDLADDFILKLWQAFLKA